MLGMKKLKTDSVRENLRAGPAKAHPQLDPTLCSWLAPQLGGVLGVQPECRDRRSR